MDELLRRMLEETKIRKYRSPPPWVLQDWEPSEKTRKGVARSRAKVIGSVKITVEQTSGGYSVKVRDAYSNKLLARSSGLDVWEADEMFDSLCQLAREEG